MEIYKIILFTVWLYLIVSTVLSYRRSGLTLSGYICDRDFWELDVLLIKLGVVSFLTAYFLHLISEQIDWSWLFIKV